MVAPSMPDGTVNISLSCGSGTSSPRKRWRGSHYQVRRRGDHVAAQRSAWFPLGDVDELRRAVARSSWCGRDGEIILRSPTPRADPPEDGPLPGADPDQLPCCVRVVWGIALRWGVVEVSKAGKGKKLLSRRAALRLLCVRTDERL